MEYLGLLVVIFLILESFLIILIWTISAKLKAIFAILVQMEQTKIRLLDEADNG